MTDRALPLSQQAYERLLAALLSGEVGPGERLVATELAERFAMSRTPVRDALKRLAVARVLEPAGGSGYRPARAPLRDLRDLLDLLALLEAQAVAALAARPRSAREAAVAALAPLAEGETDALRDHRFHVELGRAAANSYLGEALTLLNERLAPSRARLLAAAKPHPGHRAILDAIADGDPSAAGEQVAAHLAAARTGRTS